MQKKVMKPRNRHAMNPLMRKGGVHKKSKRALRSQDKANLKKELKVTDLSSFSWLMKPRLPSLYNSL